MAGIPMSIIQAGADMQGQMFNQATSALNNALDKRYNLKMYEKQRDDNITFWNMQNEYNHPSAQMARLREANLNPNMVYGNGTVGNSGGAPAPATMQISRRLPAPPISFGSAIREGIQSYVNLEQNKAQVDNLRAQNTVLVQEGALKAAQVANTAMKTKMDTLSYEIANELKQNSMDVARANLRKLNQDIDISSQENKRAEARLGLDRQRVGIELQRNERERLMNAQTIDNMKIQAMKMVDERAEILSRINNTDASTIGREFENAVKEFEAYLAKNAITPTSLRAAELFTDFVSNFITARLKGGKGNIGKGTDVPPYKHPNKKIIYTYPK